MIVPAENDCHDGSYGRRQYSLALTGTAVGVISFIGYTPEIFAEPAIGYFLDASPGKEGHQAVFWMLAIFSVIGFVASFIFYRIQKNSFCLAFH